MNYICDVGFWQLKLFFFLLFKPPKCTCINFINRRLALGEIQDGGVDKSCVCLIL